MDPRSTLLLEVAWEALENAASTPTLVERRRVYVGIRRSTTCS